MSQLKTLVETEALPSNATTYCYFSSIPLLKLKHCLPARLRPYSDLVTRPHRVSCGLFAYRVHSSHHTLSREPQEAACPLPRPFRVRISCLFLRAGRLPCPCAGGGGARATLVWPRSVPSTDPGCCLLVAGRSGSSVSWWRLQLPPPPRLAAAGSGQWAVFVSVYL